MKIMRLCKKCEEAVRIYYPLVEKGEAYEFCCEWCGSYCMVRDVAIGMSYSQLEERERYQRAKKRRDRGGKPCGGGERSRAGKERT